MKTSKTNSVWRGRMLSKSFTKTSPMGSKKSIAKKQAKPMVFNAKSVMEQAIKNAMKNLKSTTK